MEITHPISYNTRVAREIKMFIEMIEDVYYYYEDVKWSTKSNFEIGFYFRNKKKKTEYFFGIWYDLWEHYGTPLCITFSYYGKAPNQWHDKLKKFIAVNFEEGLQVKDYEGYTCILFGYSYFKFDEGNDTIRLSDLYSKVTEYADALATD
jgi:hypothetical protein